MQTSSSWPRQAAISRAVFEERETANRGTFDVSQLYPAAPGTFVILPNGVRAKLASVSDNDKAWREHDRELETERAELARRYEEVKRREDEALCNFLSGRGCVGGQI